MATLQLDADGTALISSDSWLESHRHDLLARQSRFKTALARFDPTGGLMGQISLGHRYFGFNRGELHGKPGLWYREWAPGALQLRLIGDFNNWDRWGNPMVRDEFGVWSLFLPDEKFGQKLVHGGRVKVHVVGEDSSGRDRIPAYIRRVVQDGPSGDWTGVYWDPPRPHPLRNPVPPLKGALRIYESHVGMAREEPKVGTFAEFTRDVLPRIAGLGYNAVQLMAVQE